MAHLVVSMIGDRFESLVLGVDGVITYIEHWRDVEASRVPSPTPAAGEEEEETCSEQADTIQIHVSSCTHFRSV